MIGVVYFGDLIKKSVDSVVPVTKRILIDETDPTGASFESFISPTGSPSFCSPELFSEKDSCEYVNAVLIRPALAAMHIVAANGVPVTFDCTEVNTDCYVTSGFRKEGTGPIADGVLIQGPYIKPEGELNPRPDKEDIYHYGGDEDSDEEDEPEFVSKVEFLGGPEEGGPLVLLTIEVKSSNALTQRTFEEMMKLGKERNFRDSMVIPFVWPGRDTMMIEKTTKIFAQIFEQMLYYGVEYSWLTSFNVNIFFFMKKGTRILYMSKQYDLDSMQPLYVFAWFCRASGLIPEGMVVPEPDYTYITAVDSRKTGLMVKSVRDALNRDYKPPKYNKPRPKTPGKPAITGRKTPRARTPRTPVTPRIRRIRDFEPEDASSDDVDVSDDDATPTLRKTTPRPETSRKPKRPNNRRKRNLERKVDASVGDSDDDSPTATSLSAPKPKRQRKR